MCCVGFSRQDGKCARLLRMRLRSRHGRLRNFRGTPVQTWQAFPERQQQQSAGMRARNCRGTEITTAIMRHNDVPAGQRTHCRVGGYVTRRLRNQSHYTRHFCWPSCCSHLVVRVRLQCFESRGSGIPNTSCGWLPGLLGSSVGRHFMANVSVGRFVHPRWMGHDV